jgi:prolyl-tRNA synthetase
MRLTDRHGRAFCLGPTHEELICALVRNEVRSYKELPLTLYQIQVKFRDEIRPRFGLLRGREFIMKDAYSFHDTQESLDSVYADMSSAYGKICDRLGLSWRVVEADTGQIGGEKSMEFMALAEAGEAEIIHCSCGYAANVEVGKSVLPKPDYLQAKTLTKISTPGVTAIADLADFLGMSENATVKALAAKSETGALAVFFIPGDRELNPFKASSVLPGAKLLTDEEIEGARLIKGSIGPVSLPENITIIADKSLEDIESWVTGANERDYHYKGARPAQDFTVDVWADLVVAKQGDGCPECGRSLELCRGIEVSQVFQLGDKYSRSMGATFSAEDSSEKHFLMGSYGVGVSRSMAAVVEQHHDEAGIIWPLSIAPGHICIVLLDAKDSESKKVAEKLASQIAAMNIEVIVDDRDERAGVKFADADLIGWPMQIIIGKRGLKNNSIETKNRLTGEKCTISLDTIEELLSFAHRQLRNERFNPERLIDFFGQGKDFFAHGE